MLPTTEAPGTNLPSFIYFHFGYPEQKLLMLLMYLLGGIKQYTIIYIIFVCMHITNYVYTCKIPFSSNFAAKGIHFRQRKNMDM